VAAGPASAALLELQRRPLPGPQIVNEWPLVQSVYAGRAADADGLTPLLWSGGGKPSTQADRLIGLLQAAADEGLDPADYAAADIAAERQHLTGAPQADAADWARFDVMLTSAALRLVSHLHYGRIDPRAAGFELHEPRHDLDVALAVKGVAAAPDVNGALAAVEPQFYHYGLLKNALARYRALLADASLTDLPAPQRRTLRPGDPYAGAGALRRLLAALGDLPPQAVPDAPGAGPATFDAALAAGLQRFQGRHGLTADGALDRQSYAELTTPLAARVQQIALTLERWRWLPAFDRPPIVVNIPEFDLFAFQGTADRAAAIMTMKVIVGQAYPRTETPVFTGELRYVVFRPYWDVPRSIVVREMLPALRTRPGYLQRERLQIVRGESDAATVLDPSPAALAALADGTARLRQLPGEDNALGLIKFLFPNAHDVYLHSTPAGRLFLRSRRAFSHGCIRVADPVALARYVLRNTPGIWDEAHILAAMHGADSTRVTLAAPIPVLILYATALGTRAGRDRGAAPAHQQYRNRRGAHDLLGVAAEREAADAAPSMRAHDDEVRGPLAGLGDDQIGRHAADGLEHHAVGLNALLARRRGQSFEDLLPARAQLFDDPVGIQAGTERVVENEFVDDVDEADLSADGLGDLDRLVQAEKGRVAAVHRNQDVLVHEVPPR
jgi:murein L,D-transpeptidase YcbB/YkuD